MSSLYIGFPRLLLKPNICHTLAALYSTEKQSACLGKLLGVNKKKRHWRVDVPTIPTSGINSSKSSTLGKGTGQRRRTVVLASTFQRHISDLMGSLSCAEELQSYGVQLTLVKVSNDISGVYLYWTADEVQDYEHIQQLLDTCAHQLRHQLSVIRVMSHVPKLFFIRSEKEAKMKELEALMKEADYGENYKPSSPTEAFQSNFGYEVVSSKQLNPDNEPELPKMRQNVLGVDHDKILLRITKAVEKYNRPIPVEKAPLDANRMRSLTEEPIKFNKANILDVLKKQKLMKKKIMKEEDRRWREALTADYL